MTATAASPNIDKLVREIQAFYEKQPQIYYTVVNCYPFDLFDRLLDRPKNSPPSRMVDLFFHLSTSPALDDVLIECSFAPYTFALSYHEHASLVPESFSGMHYARLLLKGRGARKRLDEMLRQNEQAQAFSSRSIAGILPEVGEEEPPQVISPYTGLGKKGFLLEAMSTYAFPTRQMDPGLFSQWLRTYEGHRERISKEMEACRRERKLYVIDLEEWMNALAQQALSYIHDRVPEEILASFKPLERERIRPKHRSLPFFPE